MNATLLRIRYYLEILAVPAFIFLVIHLSGHGLVALLDKEHDHAHHQPSSTEHAEQNINGHEILESVLTVEVLGGVLLLIFFTWLWHRPALKKWIPCSHGCCKNETALPHILAILALCLHFFPEAVIRKELLYHSLNGETHSIFGFIGFMAHFLIDIVIALLLSSHWRTRQGFWFSLSSIIVIWLLAFFLAENIVMEFSHSTEAFISLLSAFLLCMFIHKPHRS